MFHARWWRLLLAALALWLVISAGLAVAVHSYGYRDHAQEADVIVVLGAGLTRSGNPTTAQRQRTRRAAELWHEGHAPALICTGGSPHYTDRSEAETCREILVAFGVPESAIFIEDRSRSTRENAIYAREIMRARGWQSAVVVSDRYHLLRANWLFHNEGITAYTSPTAVGYLRLPQYLYYVAREVAALEWTAVTSLLGLPFTYLPVL